MVNLFGSPDTGTTLANQSGADVDIVAQDPGDIVVHFETSAGTYTFPVKSLKASKKTDNIKIYGTGSHQAYQKLLGKISYSGDFTVNTWLSRSDRMLLDRLLYDFSDEGLPRDFKIFVQDRSVGTSGTAATAVMSFTGCTVSEDAVDIGESGTPIGRSYNFEALRRDPM
jgi:hypothetical protein